MFTHNRVKISHKQVNSFACLIKDLITPFIEQNKALYIDYLRSIQDTDEDARKELEVIEEKLKEERDK